jgi:hypothetical protein
LPRIVGALNRIATPAGQLVHDGRGRLQSFVGIEIRTAEPLLPLDIIRDRARGGAYAAMALAGASVFSLFLFLAFFLQNDLRFTPLLTGVSFLLFTASVILAATINQTRVLPRLGARPVVFGQPGRSESSRHMPGSLRRSSTCPNKSAARSALPSSAPSSPAL